MSAMRARIDWGGVAYWLAALGAVCVWAVFTFVL